MCVCVGDSKDELDVQALDISILCGDYRQMDNGQKRHKSLQNMNCILYVGIAFPVHFNGTMNMNIIYQLCIYKCF